jgi:hypothetical protein
LDCSCLIQGLRTKYNGKFDNSELFKQYHQAVLAVAHWTFTSPAVMILIALAIFQIGTLIWKKCLRNKEPLALAPSALPMPIAFINPRPINKATKSNTSILISISIS